MRVANVKIIYTGESEAECSALVLQLCGAHLIAGASVYDADSHLWIGGQLTKTSTKHISGVTRPEYVSKIDEITSNFDAVMIAVTYSDIESPKFMKWFESHI